MVAEFLIVRELKKLDMSDFPLSTAAPKSEVTFIDNHTVEKAIELSKLSPRKRIITPFHKSASDKLHRMLNVIQPGSYIRPHSHKVANKCESVIVLRGGICFITFDEAGNVLSHTNIYANTDVFGVDLEANVIHAFFALEQDTVIFEVKPGPYVKELDKGFASWSPEENTPEALEFMNRMIVLTQED